MPDGRANAAFTAAFTAAQTGVGIFAEGVGSARFARLDDQLGTLSSGNIADLVLLDADPLTSIRNTRRIFAQHR